MIRMRTKFEMVKCKGIFKLAITYHIDKSKNYKNKREKSFASILKMLEPLSKS